ITSAADGDTVMIPVGRATWASKLVINKAITLKGSGIGLIIINDGVQNPNQLILWTLPAGQPSRLTGIEVEDGGRINVAYAPQGIVRIVGDNTSGATFRWDHCRWTNLNGTNVFDTVIGVVDHNTISSNVGGFATVYDTYWNGDTGNYGDKSW